MDVVFQGDVHGDLLKLAHVRYPELPLVIQVGDLGAGFVGQEHWDHYINEPNNFKFIRGNHDDPEMCHNSRNYLGDFGNWGELFYLSGAWSIDRQWRTAGVDWWPDEELNRADMDAALELYKKTTPPVVVSHECPYRIHPAFEPNRTSLLLDDMFSVHQPRLWIYGHHHESVVQTIDGCEFRCLNIDECYSTEVDVGS